MILRSINILINIGNGQKQMHNFPLSILTYNTFCDYLFILFWIPALFFSSGTFHNHVIMVLKNIKDYDESIIQCSKYPGSADNF